MNLYSEHDLEAIKILDDFLPDKIFDAHMHISLFPFSVYERFGFSDYKRDMSPLFSNRPIRCAGLATPTEELKQAEGHLRTLDFFKNQLDAHPDCVGSVLVKPGESYDEIKSHIVHPNVKGLKCYATYAKREDYLDADIHEYLTEEALEVANELGLAVTLHMMKDAALSSPDNMREIKSISKRYPNIKLVLAHAARAFASWTAIESVAELVPYENIFFDFSAICESPAMIRILNKFGASRCMWGSDYNVTIRLGKSVSIGDGFVWLEKNEMAYIQQKSPIRPRLLVTENLMATREAAIICELSKNEIESLFFNTAREIFK